MSQEQLFDAIMRGQQFRTRKREEAEAEEDRSVHKELLQHQLRTIKLQEKLQARKAALENLNMMSGMRQNEAPDSALEPLTQQQLQGDQSPNMIATMPGTITPAQRQMKPVTIPGIPEWGVGDVQRRPDTLEQILRTAREENMAKQYGETKTLSQGGMLVDNFGNLIRENPRQFAPPNPVGTDVYGPGGNMTRRFDVPQPGMIIDRGKAPDNTLVPVPRRDASGRVVTTWVPREEAAGMSAVEEPLPTQTQTRADPKGEAAEIAGKTMDALETLIDSPGFAESEEPWWGKREFTGSENTLDDTLQQAIMAKATYDSGGNSPTAAAVNAAKEYFGIGENDVRTTFSRGRLKLAIKQFKEYIGYRPQRGMNTAPGATPDTGSVIIDGKTVPAKGYFMVGDKIVVDGKVIQ